MDRRDAIKTLSASAAASAAGMLATAGPIEAVQTASRRGMPGLKITDVKVILTAPANSNLVVVKVLTSEPGLYGVGCATHQEAPYAVAEYIEKHLKPFVIGKNCDDIEDIWQSAYVQTYFRAGPTGNNAMAGVDGALWDILGKRLGVPVYQLLGGKVRAAVPLYGHASAREPADLEDQVRKYMEKGYGYVRVQLAVPGFSGYGAASPTSDAVQKMRPDGVASSPVFEPARYVTNTIKMFDYLRSKIGFDVELVHDIHERPSPNQACQLCKAVEPYRPFFMEDPFAPEDVGWFKILRQQTVAPIAMGELLVNRNQWLPQVAERLIDFIRIHK
jgi:mannonate dehydratase